MRPIGLPSAGRPGTDSMPWGVNTEFTEEEGPEVEIDEDQKEKVERSEEGTETTEDFDVDEAISNLD